MMRSIKIWAGRILFASVIAAIIAAVLVPLAYAERGYSAIGGEWLVVVMAWVGCLWFISGGEQDA